MTDKKDISDETSPRAKANRLKRVRNLANLSRNELCEDNNINLNTLIGWENARFGGLTEKGAKNIVKRLSKEGVICSISWLLYGSGLEPELARTNLQSPNREIEDKQFQHELFSEIELFKHTYNEQGIVFEISDESMCPVYAPGDYVGGVYLPENKFEQLINKSCLVKLWDNTIILRVIRSGSEKDKINLISTNPEYVESDWVFKDIKVRQIALVCRHWMLLT